MPEERRNLKGIMLKSAHKRVNFVGDIDCRIWELPCMYRELQRMVEIFIGIIFWGIRRQEEELDLLLVFFQPGRNEFSMMNLQIVQNQKYLSLRCGNQAPHKLDQPPLIHVLLVHHKADIALAADCRNHIDPLPLCLYRQNRRMSFRSKAAFHRFTVAHPCLIAPIDHSIFLCCTFQNCGGFLVFPPLDARRVLFPRTLRRTLTAHPPAFHIVRQSPLAHFFMVPLLDVLPRSPQRP